MHLDVETPTRLDDDQEALLRELAQLRGEEHPEIRATSTEQSGGLFSRLRDAFNK